MNIALIVAAGRGHRLGGPIPKQYLSLAGLPILRRTIEAFQSHPGIDAVQVLSHPNDQHLYDTATAGLVLRPALYGGATRQESVRNGLEGVADLNPAKILIHDAVRPFIEAATIAAALEALDRSPAVLVCAASVDTLKQCENGIVTATLDRNKIFRAQTPQGFRYAEILAAHRKALHEAPTQEFTDDSMIAEFAGMQVEIVLGSEQNFKITTEQDMRRAESLLGATG
jgi:2-C-methyl-D-erythritol 4-phosphate cytidylyltransferase